MTIERLKELARYSAHRTAPADFSVASVDQAFADGMKEIGGSINAFMKNRYDIYDIIIENADEIVPKKVLEQFGSFAEVRNVAQGDKVLLREVLSAALVRHLSCHDMLFIFSIFS